MNVTINYSDLCTPDVHAEGCADQDRKAVRRRGYAGSSTFPGATSVLDIAVEYWSDFVHGGFDGRLAPNSAEAAQEALDYTLSGEPKLYACVLDHLPTGDVEAWVAAQSGGEA